MLDGLDSSEFWKITGNAGTTSGTHFLGTTDAQPLELKVNNKRALRLESVSRSSGINSEFSINVTTQVKTEVSARGYGG